jgi:hypothetical protein
MPIRELLDSVLLKTGIFLALFSAFFKESVPNLYLSAHFSESVGPGYDAAQTLSFRGTYSAIA